MIAGGVRITTLRSRRRGKESYRPHSRPAETFRPRFFRTSASNPAAPPGFDLNRRALRFPFKVVCPSEFDCQAEAPCVPELQTQPAINYLAKDYASFLPVILTTRALAPEWKERNPADLGIALPS